MYEKVDRISFSIGLCAAIAGTISSVVPLSQFPANEGDANFGQVGDPYALTADGLVVLLNNEWTLFELPAEE